jgi:hypothetical protein
MLKPLKQVRAALALLNPDEVRKRAGRKVHVGLIAEDSAGFARMEETLGIARTGRSLAYRAGDPDAPAHVELVLYDGRLAAFQGAYALDHDNPAATVGEVTRDNEDLLLPLARQFPGLRKAVVDSIIYAVARENALFAVTTALPDVVPSLVELPWALGEWASDTAFLTVNQVRMAFLIAAACGREVGFPHQKFEIASIAAGAFGWRAIARELAGKIPFGGGLIPKGMIAYAGTYMVGKGLERLYHGHAWTAADREAAYQHGLERGKAAIGDRGSARLPESAI